MSDVVSQLINFIQAGDVSSAQSVCDDNSISVTHLMLASRNFVDPAQLAKQITAAPTNARRAIVVQAILNAAQASASKAQQVVEQPQQAQEEPVDLPFEPDVKPAQQPASAPARRRRAPSASIETKQITLSEAVSESTESPLGAEQQVPLPSYDKLNAVFERLEKLAGVCDEVLGRQVALDEGVGKDFGQVLESLASIRELVTTTHAEVMTNRKLILDALQAVFKFRAGTEALEIALIGKGLLDSAPFAESWNNG
jgi:hypothetical protein